MDEIRSIKTATRGEVAITFNEDKTKLRLRGLKILGISVTGGVEGKSVEESDMIDFFNRFGFRIHI